MRIDPAIAAAAIEAAVNAVDDATLDGG